MKNRLTVTLVPVDQITISPEFNRWGDSKTDDGILVKSVEKGGVQQPVILLRDGDTLHLVKGSRRIGAAKAVGIPKVSAVIDQLPDGETVEPYSRRLRFILDEHRQDLLPSQKADLILKLKDTLNLNNGQVAAYLGVDADSITNWLAIRRYVPEVVAAMDAGALTQQVARVFDGMSPEGQKHVLKEHKDDLITNRKAGVHKVIRSLYPPTKFPTYYQNADKAAARLKSKKASKRQSKPRQTFSTDEKKKLLRSVDMKEDELDELKAEQKELKEECIATGPIVAAIMRNPRLKKLVPESMLEELERFAEVY